MEIVETDHRDPRPDVLVVDDDFSIRLLVSEALTQAGFNVSEAENGRQALDEFTSRRPAVVLLDVMMPEMDGFETCAELRRQPGGEHVPILMMTGLDDVDSVNHAYAAGATDFITKPINYALLSHRVRYMLRAYETMENLSASERRLANAQRIANLGNWEWGTGSSIVSCSANMRQMLGLPKDPPLSLFSAFPWVHENDRDRVKAWFRHAIATGEAASIICRITGSDGGERHVRLQGEPEQDGKGLVCRLNGTLQDITELRLAEERIHELAYYDSLTDLPNRTSFLSQVKLALDHASRHDHLAALLFIDLDDFKRVNDSLGHAAGDKLLKLVAERINDCLYSSDIVSQTGYDPGSSNLARLGGDEFTVLLSEISKTEDAAIVADRILDEVSRPFILEEQEVFATPSIGIAIFPRDGTLTETLLKHADMAMYHAKRAGKRTYRYFDESMHESASQRLIMELHLRKALELGELYLHYQPQVDMAMYRVCGMEALLRWHNRELGPVSPATFIPLAEETGLIIPIGEWVLRTACQQARHWVDAGLPFERIAVNISVRQFSHNGFNELIETILKESGLEPSMLELEVTESLLMSDAAGAIEILRRLKAIGIRVAIDDFGTGYFNLAYLKQFPIDRIKIDRMFVRDIVADPNDTAIATAVIDMAHGMGLEVTAEGIETEAQLDILGNMHCDEAQGFYFANPMTAQDVPEHIRTYIARAAGGSSTEIANPGILLVDDDDSTLMALASMVRQAGFIVYTAKSATAGLDILAKQRVSIVISDYLMPGMDGIEFFKRVSKIHPHTIRIMLSGKSDRQTVINAINDGAISRFLDKPVKSGVLRDTLREVLVYQKRGDGDGLARQQG